MFGLPGLTSSATPLYAALIVFVLCTNSLLAQAPPALDSVDQQPIDSLETAPVPAQAPAAAQNAGAIFVLEDAAGQRTLIERLPNGSFRAVGTDERARVRTDREFVLSYLTIGLGIGLTIVLSVMTWLAKDLTENYLRGFIIIVTVFAALFLIVAGYDEQQVAPAFGILGTVLGYAFGRSTPDKPAPVPPSTPPAGGKG